MIILFPADTLEKPITADYAFKREWEVAKEIGCKTALVNFDAYSSCPTANPSARMVGNVKSDYHGEPALYRGWMMSLEEYNSFYNTVLDTGYKLINNPQQYRYGHELPQWYEDYKDITPKTLVACRAMVILVGIVAFRGFFDLPTALRAACRTVYRFNLIQCIPRD